MGGGESTPASEPNAEMERWKERNRMREEEEAEERERIFDKILRCIIASDRREDSRQSEARVS
ncbi:hypothetical protein EYF80_009522 [Liparis tanakae]|uniref:Uncharacterized protein n=1 Tax=Liparis tanakae TaxID=230148 RepID=A0A4Z2IQY8_9TELE|nr:hypothetical protein EYF80_009522 [Liparis tanakae]